MKSNVDKLLPFNIIPSESIKVMTSERYETKGAIPIAPEMVELL